MSLTATAAASILVDLRKGRDQEFYPMLAEAAEVSEAVPSDDRTKLWILRDPDVESIGSQVGSTDSPATSNTGRYIIVLKSRPERKATASQVIDRLRPQLQQVQGVNLFLQVAQDINVGGRVGRSSFQYTLQAVNIDELIEWSQKMLGKMRTLPEFADASTDLLANVPQLKVVINRDHT